MNAQQKTQTDDQYTALLKEFGTSGVELTEQMPQDWYDRLDLAESPQEMLDLLNEIHSYLPFYSILEDGQERFIMGPPPPLTLSTRYTQTVKTTAGSDEALT